MGFRRFDDSRLKRYRPKPSPDTWPAAHEEPADRIAAGPMNDHSLRE